LSLLFILISACPFFTTELGIKAGTVLDKVGASELEILKHGTGEILGSNGTKEVVTGVEVLLDTSSDKEASENSSSEVQTVQ